MKIYEVMEFTRCYKRAISKMKVKLRAIGRRKNTKDAFFKSQLQKRILALQERIKSLQKGKLLSCNDVSKSYFPKI